MNRIWHYISYLGLDGESRSFSDRSIVTSNRINFIIIILGVILNILTAINRDLSHGEYTIHTKVLLLLLPFSLINVWFSYMGWHNLTKSNLIISPSFILILLPVLMGHVQQSDFINAPLMILCFSFIPQLILSPKLTSKLYLTSFFYFLLLVFFLCDLLIYFSGQEFDIVTTTEGFIFYYKLIFTTSFIFIQVTMYHLRNINLRFETELIDTNDKLRLSIDELKTTQDNLIQSEKMASIGTLAAGIAHEINNPLNFIYGGAFYLGTYIKENFPEKIEEIRPVLEGINSGVERAAEIVKSLNQYYRTDPLPFSRCDPHSIIDDCLVILQNQFKHRIKVQKQFTQKSYVFEGNGGKLHQAFLNILTNSGQAIQANGIITILTDIVDYEMHIFITDNGSGISHDNLKKIFDPFFTTKEPGEGTGLGLSITFNIIQEHRGTIEFESEVGAGTKVTIKLPLKSN